MYSDLAATLVEIVISASSLYGQQKFKTRFTGGSFQCTLTSGGLGFRF